jgi:hypothetical protein
MIGNMMPVTITWKAPHAAVAVGGMTCMIPTGVVGKSSKGVSVGAKRIRDSGEEMEEVV